ncbi:MAG TPA: hypothetical protein PKY77_24475 [Phycisphaerae bacterium]|nr:hypothetical protein [Phycisphaerae bacterium]HRY70686.1 hypothetical protein [Phycisphaerae bacterium]HSA28719.1 hypothetical protein [Phycisphaerae bacterium]
MYQTDLSRNTQPAYAGRAYHYQYGRHRLYGNLQTTPLYSLRPLSYVQTPTPRTQPAHGIDDGPQTVEDLIHQGYFAVPAHEPETAGLFDRKHTSWMALDDILGQVRRRQEAYQRNMLDILWSECYAFNELARHGRPAPDEAYAAYEKRMQDLRSEQRAERITFWRDVSRIREGLPESAQQYLSAFRKLQILGDDGGDQP